MKKYLLFILSTVFILHGCASNSDNAMDTTVHDPESADLSQPMPQPETTTLFAEAEVTTEQSFVATIMEETFSYMIVEPDEEEEERKLSDRITIKFPSEHSDYLYGKGRRVVIYYTGTPTAAGTDFEIITDDISTEGFREFELSVTPSEKKEKILILSSEEIENFDSFPDSNTANLYYYGLSEVQITVDHRTMPLAEALKKGKITLNGIISDANNDVKNGTIKEMIYRDGGSAVYQYETYTIIKYHTADGNRDVYIGSTDMDIDCGKN